MKEKLMGMINLWSTVGGLIGVLLVFPYISMKINDVESRQIERELEREKSQIEREKEREADQEKERLAHYNAQKEAMDDWAEEFLKELPIYVDSLTDIKIDSKLLVKIPVSHVNTKTGRLTPAGTEYYIKINGKYKKIEEKPYNLPK